MDKQQLVQFIRNQLQGCAGWGADGIQAARTSALTYYLQRPRGDEVQGRSGVVSGDLSASVEANLAQLMQAYTTSNVAEFDPTGEDDEDQCQLETDTVVYMTMRQQDGFIQLATATKDALLQRVGIMKAWCEEKKVAKLHTFDNVESEETVAYILDAIGENAELVNYVNGSATVRLIVTKTVFRNAAIAPENFFYGAEEWDYNLQNIEFCAERHVEPRYKLYERFGQEQVDRLTAFSGTGGRPDAAARNPSNFPNIPVSNGVKAYDRIEWLECYALVDLDGDGIPERNMIPFVWNDSVVLGEDETGEPRTIVPYAMGTTLLMPHRLTGLSQYDKLRVVQDENTGMKRARDDNVNAVNQSRTVSFENAVNRDDMSNGRHNGDIRVKEDVGITDVRQAVAALVVPDNTQNILANIESIKRDGSEMGGAALKLASGEMQIGGDRMGSEGLDRAYSVAEALGALMMQTLAATLVRNLFLVAHATLREHYTGAVNIKVNGRWFSPVPAKWSERDAVTVKLGQSPGERARRATALRQIIQDQIFLVQNGMEGVLVNVERFYRAYMDWARVADVPIPEQYYIDPQSDEAQSALQNKAQTSKVEQQKRDNLLSEAVKLRKIEVATPKYVADQKTTFDYWAKTIDAEIEEAKIAGPAVAQLLTHKRGTDETQRPAKGTLKSVGGK
jgi:hypothetical protein